ncbi:hypothetical protein KAX01_03335, partial [Candidatus Bathyarchaeota archaeon]|nr:hypothetical protein [Candidatus Bathyarchaeota archaeon]
MVDQKDVMAFLKENDGQASLDEISEGLRIAKYGPESAYAMMQSLKSSGVVDRKGEMWVLTAETETLAAEDAIEERMVTAVKGEGEPTSDVDKIVQAMAKTLATAMKEAQEPADEWELATRPM